MRVKKDLADDTTDNVHGLGWVRNTLSAVTREIAGETRALRLLHQPDMRTPAQKRKDMEARAAGGVSVAATTAAATDAAAAPKRIAAREEARVAAALLAPVVAWQRYYPAAGGVSLSRGMECEGRSAVIVPSTAVAGPVATAAAGVVVGVSSMKTEGGNISSGDKAAGPVAPGGIEALSVEVDIDSGEAIEVTGPKEGGATSLLPRCVPHRKQITLTISPCVFFFSGLGLFHYFSSRYDK